MNADRPSPYHQKRTDDGDRLGHERHLKGSLSMAGLGEAEKSRKRPERSVKSAPPAIKSPPKKLPEKAEKNPTCRQGSLVNHAIQSVTSYIRDNNLRVGDSLPGEKYFADALRVSRAVMREAYGALTALQLIDVGNGRRPKVSRIDGSVIATLLNHAVSTAQISVAEIWDVRRTIEARTAMLAASLRTDEEAREILALSERIAENYEDMAVMVPSDIAFHQAIARASHNALFAQIEAAFEPLMRVATVLAWRTRTTRAQRKDVVRRHVAIAKAIAKRDPDAAVAAMDSHFDASIHEILQRFRNSDPVSCG